MRELCEYISGLLPTQQQRFHLRLPNSLSLLVTRFAQDSCIAQNTNLKDTFATLRGQTDPKRAVPYFDISTTCTVLSPPWVGEDVLPYSNFIKRYAEYVFNRVAWFGPGFRFVCVCYFAMILAHPISTRPLTMMIQ